MTENQSAVVDVRSGKKLWIPIDPPLLTSSGDAWDGISLAEMRHGGWTGSDIILEANVVSLTLDNPLTLDWRVGGRSQPKNLLPGHLTFIPAGVPFSVSHEGSAWYINVWLTPQFMAQALGPNGLSAVEQLSPRCCFRDENLSNIIESLRTEAAAPGGGDAARIASLGNLLAVGLAKSCATADPLDRFDPRPLSFVKLRRVMEFIEERLMDQVTLSDMAAVAGLSAWHFARAFKLATGTSPHSFLLRRRLVKADTLLRLPGIAVSEVAVKSGFCDQSHLSMHFRRATGMTPARWRNSFSTAAQTTEISTTA